MNYIHFIKLFGFWVLAAITVAICCIFGFLAGDFFGFHFLGAIFDNRDAGRFLGSTSALIIGFIASISSAKHTYEKWFKKQPDLKSNN